MLGTLLDCPMPKLWIDHSCAKDSSAAATSLANAQAQEVLHDTGYAAESSRLHNHKCNLVISGVKEYDLGTLWIERSQVR